MDYVCRKLTVEDIDMVMDMNNNYIEFIDRDYTIEFLADDRNCLLEAVMDNIVAALIPVSKEQKCFTYTRLA